MTVAWAIHRLSGVASPANAAYSAEELVYQLKSSKAKCLFTVSLLTSNLCSILLNIKVHSTSRNSITSRQAMQHPTGTRLYSRDAGRILWFQEGTIQDCR